MLLLSVPFFLFLGAGTSSHPDSVGCVTDIIGLQCGESSISITDNWAADYLEEPTGRYLRKRACSTLKVY